MYKPTNREREALRQMYMRSEQIKDALIRTNATEELVADDYFIQAAFTKLTEEIGEQAKHLSNDFRESNNEIPWAAIAGMRNRLVHAYGSVNWKLLWESLTVFIPKMASYIDEHFKDELANPFVETNVDNVDVFFDIDVQKNEF